MRITNKFLLQMIEDINKTYNTDYSWSGSMITWNVGRACVGMDSNREAYSFLCGIHNAL